MKSKIIILIVLLGVGFVFFNNQKSKSSDAATSTLTKIKPVVGEIRAVISTTGTVEPQNRLEIKPQVNGRIEEILVKEGDQVKKGDILAWMSSTERAALLDAARNQGPEKLKYWQEVYKPTPLIAPINGEVIVRDLEPGQSITMETPVIVLSDRLIVKAQVDETDIGKIKVGQSVEISLDAYPDSTIKGIVNHVAYESTMVNNVIIYAVDIIPVQAPAYFRSGMGANVSIITKLHTNALLIPLDAVVTEKDKDYVLIPGKTDQPQKKAVAVGLKDEKNAEITEGLSLEDEILVKPLNYKLPSKKAGGGNPFMPARRPGGGGH